MSRRLPLYRPAPLEEVAYEGVPRPLPGRAISVLDPLEGHEALAFALRLSQELARFSARAPEGALRPGRVLPLVVATLGSLPPAQSEIIGPARAEPLYALSIAASAEKLERLAERGPDGLWVVVGQAALCFAPALTILVRAELPVLRWPAPLREARARVDLALSGDGLAVASALARVLVSG